MQFYYCHTSVSKALSLFLGGCVQRGLCVQRVSGAHPLDTQPPGPRGRHHHPQPLPQTLDITLPQTSFVGGKNLIFFQALTLALALTLLDIPKNVYMGEYIFALLYVLWIYRHCSSRLLTGYSQSRRLLSYRPFLQNGKMSMGTAVQNGVQGVFHKGNEQLICFLFVIFGRLSYS